MFTSTTPEHTGVPQRPPASAHFLVSSTDRYQDNFDRLLAPTTSANWNMSKQYNLLNGYFTRLAMTQLQVQWNLPTIIENVNDEFTLVMNEDVTISIVISPGWKTLADIAAEIQSEVRADGNYVSGWNFTCTVVNNSLVMNATVPMVPFVGEPGSLNQQINKFLITVGLFITDATLVSGVYVIQGAPAPMTYTKFIDVCSSRLTQFQRVKDATTLVGNVNSDVIARIYPCPPNVLLNSSQPGQLFSEPWVMTIDYNTPKHIKWSPDQAINNFDIQLKDEFGDIIFWSVQYPTEYQMTFLASET